MRTEVHGLVMLDFLVTPIEDEDDYKGVGVLLRDPEQQHHAVYYWQIRPFACLWRMRLGVAYELRDEIVDLAAAGLMQLPFQQTREFIGALGDTTLTPVVKRVELGARADGFQLTHAIPARTR